MRKSPDGEAASDVLRRELRTRGTGKMHQKTTKKKPKIGAVVKCMSIQTRLVG